MPETALAYSESGVGKTSLLIGLSKWMYESFGLMSRLISHDLGGWGPVEREGLIYHSTKNKEGIIQATNISSTATLLSDTRKLARGYWPKLFKNQETGVITKRIVEDTVALSKIGLYFIEGCSSISDGFMHFCVQEETEEGGSIGPQRTSGKFEQEGEIIGGNSEGHYNIT